MFELCCRLLSTKYIYLIEGASDKGEGVGDDSHSWAYDGYRRLIWHEKSAEWGGKAQNNINFIRV